MTSLLGRIVSGIRSKMYLVVDLSILLLSIVLSQVISQGRLIVAPELFWFCGTACLTWMIGATALRYYDPWSHRERLDDVALGSVLLLA